MTDRAPILSKHFAPWPADDPLHRPAPRLHADCAICQALQTPAGGMDMRTWITRLGEALAVQCPACGQPWGGHAMAHPHTGAPCAGVEG